MIGPGGTATEQLVVLSCVAHVDRAGQALRLRADALLVEPALRLRREEGEGLLQLGPGRGGEGLQAGGREIRPQIGQQQAHGAEDAGIAGHQDAADIQLARQPRRVQRPRAAEGAKV